MLGFGLPVALNGALATAVVNVDYVIVGWLLGTTAVGIYLVGFRIPELLVNSVFQVFSQVTYPVYTRLNGDRERLGRAYLLALRVQSLWGLSVGTTVAVLSPVLVPVLFGEQYADSVTVMQAIAAYVVLGSLSTGVTDLFKAVGKPHYGAMLQAARLVVLVPTLVVATRWGLTAVAVAVALVALVFVVVVQRLACRLLDLRWSALLGTLRVPVLAAVAAGLVAWAVMTVLSGAAGIARARGGRCGCGAGHRGRGPADRPEPGDEGGARVKVLVVDGSRGQTHTALSTVRALAAAGHEVDLAHVGPSTVAARSRHVARRFDVPSADAPGFAAAVRGVLDEGRHVACFPSSDAALVALDWAGADLVDKREVQKRWQHIGALQPRSWEFASGPALLEQVASLEFPVAVKSAAKVGEGAPAVWRADGVDDLWRLTDVPTPVYAEEWLEGEQSALCGVVHHGRLLAAVHQRYLRTWPVEVGDASAAVTTEPDLDLERQVTDALSGYDGVFQVELIAGVVHDVNPRVYGSISLAVHAGVNLPDLAARLSAGQAPPAATLRAPAGVRHRWMEGDLRHVATGVRGRDLTVREAAAVLRPRRGTVHPDLVWSDLRPTLARLGFAARRVTP